MPGQPVNWSPDPRPSTSSPRKRIESDEESNEGHASQAPARKKPKPDSTSRPIAGSSSNQKSTTSPPKSKSKTTSKSPLSPFAQHDGGAAKSSKERERERRKERGDAQRRGRRLTPHIMISDDDEEDDAPPPKRPSKKKDKQIDKGSGKGLGKGKGKEPVHIDLDSDPEEDDPSDNDVDDRNEHQLEVSTLLVRELQGNLPPFSDWTNWLVDHDAEKIYLYGGCLPGDEDNEPRSDFYMLDVSGENLVWKNLNESLRYRSIDPFSSRNGRREFPALRHPGMTLCPINGRKYIFFFGGYSEEYDRVVSDLIAVDIEKLEWWVVNIEGGPAKARMEAAIVAINNTIYIFGGRSNFWKSSEIFSTFCVAEYHVGKKTWMWTKLEEEYDQKVPVLGFGMVVVPFPEERQILLLPGRRTMDAPFNVIQQRTFLFNIETFEVKPVRIPGDFPGHLLWYDAGSLKYRGKAQRHLFPPLSNTRPLKFPLLVGGWVSYNSRELTPELWQFNLRPPGAGVSCLDVKDTLYDLDLDLQIFLVCNGRAFLFGYEHPGEEDYQHPPEDSKWNISVEIVFA